MLRSWGILRLAASSFCCDLTSFLKSKLAASPKKLNLSARNSSFWLFLGSKNLTTSFKIWIAQHSVVIEQSCKWQKYSRVRHQFKSASTFDLGCVTFLGRVTKNDMTIASDRRKYYETLARCIDQGILRIARWSWLRSEFMWHWIGVVRLIWLMTLLSKNASH